MRNRPQAQGWRVYRRGDWGAAPMKDNHDPMARVRRITLHHTATSAETGSGAREGGENLERKNDLETVKAIQHFHRDVRGWADIGYHWLIGRDGNVYEGRDLAAQGAHAGGGNNVENLGISVIGDFTSTLPSPRQLRTIAGFLDAEMRRYRVPAAEVYGHRDFKATECPGSALYEWLQGFKQQRA